MKYLTTEQLDKYLRDKSEPTTEEVSKITILVNDMLSHPGISHLGILSIQKCQYEFPVALNFAIIAAFFSGYTLAQKELEPIIIHPSQVN